MYYSAFHSKTKFLRRDNAERREVWGGNAYKCK
jgi:hypothetical protein